MSLIRFHVRPVTVFMLTGAFPLQDTASLVAAPAHLPGEARPDDDAIVLSLKCNVHDDQLFEVTEGRRNGSIIREYGIANMRLVTRRTFSTVRRTSLASSTQRFLHAFRATQQHRQRAYRAVYALAALLRPLLLPFEPASFPSTSPHLVAFHNVRRRASSTAGGAASPEGERSLQGAQV